uniref:Uncharacterized protein n=1 Tax=Myotis myotis TaxID=51298 RepID=A0A7J7RUP2_MYOMY|nr:hypothetical protein mMyoMyo1_010119 [Myotis myotis]
MDPTACLLAPWGPCPSSPRTCLPRATTTGLSVPHGCPPQTQGAALPLLTSPAVRSSDTAWGPPPVATVGLARAGTAVSTQGAPGGRRPRWRPPARLQGTRGRPPRCLVLHPRSARAPGSGVRDGQTPDTCLRKVMAQSPRTPVFPEAGKLALHYGNFLARGGVVSARGTALGKAHRSDGRPPNNPAFFS